MTRPLRSVPVALTIAGSDSGGGAGIQADLKTFASLGVHGTVAITCVTAQNPSRVFGIQPLHPRLVRSQITAVWSELRPSAAKTGMLFSAAIVRAVAQWFRSKPRPHLVVDPVMISTSGRRLLASDAIAIMKKELLPLAILVTPNVPEAETILRIRIRSPEDMRTAARRIHELFGCAALLKGGHLPGCREACDIFYDGTEELLLTTPFLSRGRMHGTGCTLSAAVTAGLASGMPLRAAVVQGKQYVFQAIARSRRVGKSSVLNYTWE